MRKWRIAEIAAGMLLPLTATPLSAQVAEGIVLISPKAPEVTYSLSTESSSENDFSSMRAFRNDSFLTLRPDIDEMKTGDSGIKLNPVFHILSEDYDYAYRDLEKYEKETFLNTYMDSLNEELQSDPFYHIDRDIDTDTFLYEEQSWDALASALKKKYEIVRQADKFTKQLENKVTLSYKTEGGASVKLRPGIDRTDGSYKAMLRCSIKCFLGIERIETRIGEDCVKIRLACFITRKKNSKLAVEYESVLENDENDQEQRNEVSQIVMEVPFW